MVTPVNNRDQFITHLQEMLSQTKDTRGVSSSIIARNPDLAALASKLVTKPATVSTNVNIEKGDLGMITPGIDQISKRIMSKVEDAENIFKLFPDIELAAQIVISSILSPKDMFKTELIYRFENSTYPPALTSRFVEIIREEFKNYYKIQDDLYDIIRDAMFRGGSHPRIVLPEAAVDHVINSAAFIATESVANTEVFIGNDLSKVRPLGFLGTPGEKKEKPALESLFSFHVGGPSSYEAKIHATRIKIDDVSRYEGIAIESVARLIEDSVEVIDNHNFLKVPDLVAAVRKQKVSELTGNRTVFSRESFESSRLTPEQLSSMIYKGVEGEYRPYTSIPSQNNLRRRSVGRPLVINASAESIIPVYLPGDYRNHIGYFLVVDADGNPVTLDSNISDFGQGLSSLLNGDKNGNGTGAQLTDKAARNLISDQNTPMIDRIGDLVSDIIEKDLMERLSRGVYGQELAVGKNVDVYRIMLARALKGRFTKLVYVPAEYVTYFAFEYHRNGTGRSYLDELSNIIGMRAMVLFSKIWAQVRSSISTVSANIVFDPREPDPIKTIEIVKSLVARSRQQFFPNGLRNVSDFTDWIHRAGIEITFEGHPRLPNTKIEFESKNIDHVQPNDELDELLRHMCYMHFGLSPETVDTAAKADFATTIQQGSILFARRVMQWGKCFSIDLTSLHHKTVMADETIKKRLVELLNEFNTDIVENLTDEQKQFLEADRARFTNFLLNDMVSKVKVELPEPNTISQNTMKEEIDNYEALVDKALGFIFSSEALPSDIAGESSNFISNLKETYKAEIMRRYFADNNIVPEVFDITTRDQKDQPMSNFNKSIRDHSANAIASVLTLMNMMKSIRAAADKDIENMNVEPGEGGSNSSDDSGDGDSGTGDEFGFDDGMGDGDPFTSSEDTGSDGTNPDEPSEESEASDEKEASKAEPEA